MFHVSYSDYCNSSPLDFIYAIVLDKVLQATERYRLVEVKVSSVKIVNVAITTKNVYTKSFINTFLRTVIVVF